MPRACYMAFTVTNERITAIEAPSTRNASSSSVRRRHPRVAARFDGLSQHDLAVGGGDPDG
jgi:hypothetical protein